MSQLKPFGLGLSPPFDLSPPDIPPAGIAWEAKARLLRRRAPLSPLPDAPGHAWGWKRLLLRRRVLAVPVVLPETLIDAVILRLNDRVGSLASWIGTGEAPPGTPPVSVLPWVRVVEVNEDRIGSSSADDYIDKGTLQVSVFAAGKSLARSTSKAFAAALNDAPLVFEDGRLLELRQGGRPIVVQDPVDGAGGEDIWQEARTYRYVLQSTFPAGD